MRHCYMCERELWRRNGSHARRGEEEVEIEKMGKGRSGGGGGGGEREGGREDEEEERERERYRERDSEKGRGSGWRASRGFEGVRSFFCFWRGRKKTGERRKPRPSSAVGKREEFEFRLS